MNCPTEDYRIIHRLSVAYLPWVNGTLEFLMHAMLVSMRSMIAELKLALQDWLLVLHSIVSALNKASLDSLGKRPDGMSHYPF